MRPQSAQLRFFAQDACLSHGLPQKRDLVYNHRQELPIPSELNEWHSSDSLPHETEMDPSRPGSTGENLPKSDRETPRVETREERLERIRKEIEAGTYETPEKMEKALERMFGTFTE